MNKIITKTLTLAGYSEFIKVFTGIAISILIVIFPPPSIISQFFFQPNWLALGFLFIFFALLFNKTGKRWEVLQFSFTLGLFVFPLIYKWQVAYYGESLIGGLLPWSDAGGYLYEAQRLVSGLLLSAWGAQQRPFFSGLLAVVLRLLGEDLMGALFVFTLLNAIAVFYATHAIKKIFHPLGAAIYLLMAYEFYLRFAGLILTEQAGFLLGNFSFFFVLVGLKENKFWYTLWGFALLSLALIVRAGAFLILPVLALWIVIKFKAKVTWWRTAVYSTLIIVLVFVINSLFAFLLSGRTGTTFVSYSYALYGLASGNKGWQQVVKDYPDITPLEVMPLAIQKIREEPKLLLLGMKGSFLDYFKENPGAFSFIIAKENQKDLNLFLWGFAFIGLAYSLQNIKMRDGISFVSFLGIVFSLTLLPPIDSDKMRVFAVTIPFTILWVVEGMFAVFIWLKKLFFSNKAENINLDALDVSIKPVLGLSAFIILLTIMGPFFLRIFPVDQHSFSSGAFCDSSEVSIRFFILKNASFTLIEDKNANESYVPYVRVSDFREFSKNGLYPVIEEKLMGLEVGDSINYGIRLDEKIPRPLYLISNFQLQNSVDYPCGQYPVEEFLRLNAFFELKSEVYEKPGLTISQRYPSVTYLLRMLYALSVGIVITLLLAQPAILMKKWLLGNLHLLSFRSIVLFLLLSQGVLMNFYTNGDLFIPLLKQRVLLPLTGEYFTSGNLIVVPLGTTWMNQAEIGNSPVVVYEDNIPLAYPNSFHQDIIDNGNGRFSVWNGSLYLSSSDNTDPRTNGRAYEIEWPYPIPPVVEWTSYLASIGGIVYIIFLFVKHGYKEKKEKTIA